MGYAYYTIVRNGVEIEAGYGVETTCEQDGCTTKIDRGLGYLCGTQPGGSATGCGGYFCGEDLYLADGDDDGYQCAACSQKAMPKQYVHAALTAATAAEPLCGEPDGPLAAESEDITCPDCLEVLSRLAAADTAGRAA